MTFPTSRSVPEFNDDGELMGWDRPDLCEPEYCDYHGISFMSVVCPACADEDEYDDEADEDDDEDYSDE